jgi:hypothetical protein
MQNNFDQAWKKLINKTWGRMLEEEVGIEF